MTIALSRRALIFAATAAASLGGWNTAQSSPLATKVENYLNQINTLRARFSQIAPDGSMTTGELMLQRPGRMRLDYDPPSGVLLIAPGDWRLIFYDASIKQVNVIPIDQTPLGFLLEDRVTLSGDVEVVDQKSQGSEVGLTLVRTAEPDQGNVTLIFSAEPLELRRWVVVDAQGLSTHVLLESLEYDSALDPDLFHWRDPKIFGFPEN